MQKYAALNLPIADFHKAHPNAPRKISLFLHPLLRDSSNIQKYIEQAKRYSHHGSPRYQLPRNFVFWMQTEAVTKRAQTLSTSPSRTGWSTSRSEPPKACESALFLMLDNRRNLTNFVLMLRAPYGPAHGLFTASCTAGGPNFWAVDMLVVETLASRVRRN